VPFSPFCFISIYLVPVFRLHMAKLRIYTLNNKKSKRYVRIEIIHSIPAVQHTKLLLLTFHKLLRIQPSLQERLLKSFANKSKIGIPRHRQHRRLYNDLGRMQQQLVKVFQSRNDRLDCVADTFREPLHVRLRHLL